ncbi:hypothetical protein NSQ38_02575 [Paenibacillus sp. FSL R7-0313]|uniref:hypothetical protein n=1 Tax=Paenibacillus sp. FSL R7-0313 TaxID=2954532 RepID=UPI0030D78A25
MKIRVEYKDVNGQINNQIHILSRIAFAKHLGIAGQGYAPKPQKLIRTISMFLHYSSYIQRKAFYEDRFSEPSIELSDPTEKGQFSNLAGKAIADFLSKRIDQSIFTVNYEAAMKMKGMALKGGRPDLFAFKKSGMFALEAKGYSGRSGDMQTHKIQSQTGGIPVNFTVACVSYNLYKNIRCKYYDPLNDAIEFDSILLRQLTSKYYTGLLGFLNNEHFEYSELVIQGESFYEVNLSDHLFRLFSDESLHNLIYLWKFHCDYKLSLILPRKIREYAKDGLEENEKPFLLDSKENTLYIDNDRVGLRINRY